MCLGKVPFARAVDLKIPFQ
uniref:Uncharacterized protein n=1 Tax=Anguilla anguilla TaxID=7936 RepID=A0A0E9XBJ8_ANGAN